MLAFVLVQFFNAHKRGTCAWRGLSGDSAFRCLASTTRFENTQANCHFHRVKTNAFFYVNYEEISMLPNKKILGLVRNRFKWPLGPHSPMPTHFLCDASLRIVCMARSSTGPASCGWTPEVQDAAVPMQGVEPNRKGNAYISTADTLARKIYEVILAASKVRSQKSFAAKECTRSIRTLRGIPDFDVL